MGRLLLIWRLVVGDIKRRPVQSALLVVMILTTTTALTLGLALHGESTSPFALTRAATSGPDVVAETGFAPGSSRPSPQQLAPLLHASGVAATGGPYPVALARLTAPRISVPVQAVGRDIAPAAIDRPLVVAGHWVRPGGAVIERGFADALGLHVGDSIRVGGHAFGVAGIALSTQQPFYPACEPGLIWLTRADAHALATPSRPLGYLLEIRLTDPASASAFGNTRAVNAFATATANEPSIIEPWQIVRHDDYKVIALDQKVLLIGAWLLSMLAIASIAVVVGGRMAEQTRRVGLLKAVGGTPALIAVVLLAENLVLALARTSTIRALHDPAHPPKRRPWLIALSARLPVPMLFGLRLVSRRARRAFLTCAGLLVAVTMVVAALVVQHNLQVKDQAPPPPGFFVSSRIGDSADHVLIVLSVILVILAAITAIFTAWATAIDAQGSAALARAFGATPRQISGGLTTAQLLPALVAACLGIPAGLLLYQLAGGQLSEAEPPLLWLLAVIPGTLVAVAVVTAIPARIGARRPVAEVLRAE